MSTAIIIPVERESAQLETAIELVQRNTKDYELKIVLEPDVSVSGARQKAMDETSARHVCFLDYDSEMITPGWLEMMLNTMREKEAMIVFGREWWGEEAPDRSIANSEEESGEVHFGPAACMLIDREKLPKGARWDEGIGLRNGWLGGDTEELDYVFQAKRDGGKLFLCPQAIFHHTGGRNTIAGFMSTDRYNSYQVMRQLIAAKHFYAPDDKDWFKGLRYVKADPNNDLMLAPGASLRECYRDVIVRNGLSHVPLFRKTGLI